MNRLEIYLQLKELQLVEKCNKHFKKNYTNVKSNELLAFIEQETQPKLKDIIIKWQIRKGENAINDTCKDNPYTIMLFQHSLEEWKKVIPTITTLYGINITPESLALSYDNGKHYYTTLKTLLNV
jgi:hypothetical protein